MSMIHQARLAARRFGVDVRRWPDGEVGDDRVKLLRHFGVDTVLDVGANDGGYARDLRAFKYDGRLVSFEPLAAPRDRLIAGGIDPKWTVLPYGLADFDGNIDIHVAGNNEMSSSVLPMLDAHVTAAPEAGYQRVETCQVRRLDSVWPEVSGRATFLKIDVQGFEKSVLDGATSSLDKVAGVQIELSFIPLYEGGMLWDEALGRLTGLGFTIVRIDQGFRDLSTGRVYQADAVLFRL